MEGFDFSNLAIAAVLFLIVAVFVLRIALARKEEDEWRDTSYKNSSSSDKGKKMETTVSVDIGLGKCTLDIQSKRVDDEDGGEDQDEDPDDDEDEEEDADLYYRAGFWVCAECGNEFRILDGSLPKCCPCCGADTIRDEDDDTEDEEDRYEAVCPYCHKKFFIIGEEDPDYCPYCGRERRGSDDWAIYMGDLSFRKPFWTCDSCGLEFRLDGEEYRDDIICPSCGGSLVAKQDAVPPDEADGEIMTCSHCKHEFFQISMERVKQCPCCGHSWRA